MATEEYKREKEGSKICKISINQDSCISCGTCVAIDSNTYKLNDENKSIVIDANVADDETLITSEEACPVKAISLTDK